MSTGSAAPFDLLQHLYGDAEMAEVFSERSTIRRWLAVEAALARAQGRLGVIPERRARAIAEICSDESVIDAERLWDNARTVGYPILGLVRQIDAALGEDDRGSVHLGATTQDIMDTALAMQLRDVAELLDRRTAEFGASLSAQVSAHDLTVMAGRTHGQQAVPTTLGAKLAVFLSEVTRHRRRLRQAAREACVVSLFGAGGTSAALGPEASQIRSSIAQALGLADTAVPWHVARDSIVHLADVAALAAGTCARLAREVIDLSRTEIGELGEATSHHRGASSTMPQKANPIYSESVIGFSVSARSAAAGLSRALEAGHERSAGEWQVEWSLLPAVFAPTSAALRLATQLSEELVVWPTRMRENLGADGGLIMCESVMISLAPHLGREDAHDVVYALALEARRRSADLAEVLREWQEAHPEVPPIDVQVNKEAVGQAVQVCAAAREEWHDNVPSSSRQQGADVE